MVRPSGDGSLKPQQGAGPLSQSDASSDVARDQSVVRNARHNAAIAWIRLPISLVVSGFLFIFTTSAIGLAWLGALLVIELFAWGVRKRLVAGDLRFRMPHLAAICLVSLAWVALGLLLWGSGHEVARIASLVALFSVAFYGVAVNIFTSCTKVFGM